MNNYLSFLCDYMKCKNQNNTGQWTPLDWLRASPDFNRECLLVTLCSLACWLIEWLLLKAFR